MITAFQVGAFQFTGFQEGLGVGSGGYRPTLSPWGLRHALELRARRLRQIEDEEHAKRETVEHVHAQSTPILRADLGVAVRAIPPIATLKLSTAPLLDVDTELEEFGALMKALAEMDEVC